MPLSRSRRAFEECCARRIEFGDLHSRDYELLYGREWMSRATPSSQGAEIAQFATVHATEAAYPILIMLHGVVMHKLSNKERKLTPIERQIRSACLEVCMSLMQSARTKG